LRSRDAEANCSIAPITLLTISSHLEPLQTAQAFLRKQRQRRNR
jgi:hypothetical protein